MDQQLRRRQRALFVFFFLPGVALASWVTRTPEIRDAIGASVAQMGLVLFGMSMGSMAGILGSGRIVSRFGTRFASLLGLWLVFVSLLAIALGVIWGSQLVAAVGLGFFGLGMGVAEIGINLDASQVERLVGRPVLHTLHGCFSLGTLCGALVGLSLISLGVAVRTHMLVMAVLVAVMILIFRGGMVAGFGIGSARRVDMAGGRPVWRDPRVLLIGMIVFAMALAEGSANDWLPIVMVDEHGFSQASGSLIFVGFAAAMTVGRFGGGFFLHRFGATNVMRVCAALGAAGIGYIALGSTPWMAGVAVVMWGIGASLGFPVALSAAGRGGEGAVARVKAVAIVGYVAMLVGPPGLGMVGESYGLRVALLIVMALVAGAFCIAPAVGPERD